MKSLKFIYNAFLKVFHYSFNLNSTIYIKIIPILF